MNSDIESINKKLDILLDFEKGLAKELKSNKADVSDIKEDIERVHKKIAELEEELNTVKKHSVPQAKRSYKDFSAKEIYDLHYESGMSLSKLASYLNCSVGTVIHRINAYKKKEGLIR